MQRRRAGKQSLYNVTVHEVNSNYNSALRDSLIPFLYRTHFLRYTEFTERRRGLVL